MKVNEIVNITQGRLLSGSPDADVEPSKISTDSRTIRKGEFFIALNGPNYDGNDFVEDALKKGATGALVAHRPSQIKDYRRGLIVQTADTTKALQDIAAHHRLKFKIPIIGVTGSNGKTTVKEMIWNILSSKYDVLKNEGTKNNYIGVPQTLLKLESPYDMCVLELGANHKGEIGLLAKMARPTIAVITNIGQSHLEFLKDLKGVFEAKREILEYLDENSLAVLNGDDEYLFRIRKRKFDILKFGLKDSNDFKASSVSAGKNRLKFLLNGKTTFSLNLLGIQNIYNALAAIAVSSRFGISYETMRRALYDYKPTYMRLEIKKINGLEIIDDSYNSNPSSMKCALEVLRRYPAKARWVVSGDMLELGERSEYFHSRVGEEIARSGVRGLVTFGEFSKATLFQAKRCGMKKEYLWHCSTHDAIARVLSEVAEMGDAILIKGSRAMRMEEVIQKLKTQNSKLKD